MNEIEVLDGRRRRMWMGFLAGFTAWQLPLLIEGFSGNALPPAVMATLGGLTVIGALVFTFYIFSLLRLRNRICSNRQLAQALDDERIRHNRLQVGYTALILVLGVLALFRAAVEFWALPTEAVLQTCLVVAVACFIGGFLVLERQG